MDGAAVVGIPSVLEGASAPRAGDPVAGTTGTLQLMERPRPPPPAPPYNCMLARAPGKHPPFV